MQALVKYASGPEKVEIRDVPAPQPTSANVIIDVAAVAICGTDRLAVEGVHDFDVPRTLGHEASGTVRHIGEGSGRPDLSIGDRVTVETDSYLCMECEYCRTGQYNRCPRRLGIGTTTDGALAEQLTIPGRAVHVLPPNVSLLEGALTEPLAVAVHAVIEQSESIAGRVVVVIGPGAVGQLCAQVAHAVGATVVLIGRSRHSESLKKARESGMAHTIDSETEDVKAVIDRLTDGYGAHTVYECSGATGILADAIPLLRRGGRIVLVAFFREHPQVDFDAVINRELVILGSRGKRPSSYRTALQLMAEGRVDVGSLIQARLPLSQWQVGLDQVALGKKVVFELAGDVT
ncbi:MAG: zinc-binding dehydrogenase [Pseudolysinimonas sp.]